MQVTQLLWNRRFGKEAVLLRCQYRSPRFSPDCSRLRTWRSWKKSILRSAQD